MTASDRVARVRRRPACRSPLRAAGALALAVGVAATVLAAPSLEFSASVDQSTLGLGEQFQLTLTVRGEDLLSVPSPAVPSLADFTVLGSTTSQATNISIVNGQMKKQATVNFIYALAAKRLGKAIIPACKLTYQGQEYQSQPIEITVVKAAQGRAAQAPGMPGMPGVPATRQQLPLEGNLYLAVTPSRKTIYVGEPVTVDVSLYTRFQISNGGWAQPPSFDGFWAEKIFEADKFDFHRRTIDGKAFGVAMLRKVALVPLSPGSTTIKPMVFNVAVTQQSRDFFDLFGTTQTVRVESKPVTLEVLPVPEKGKPKEFTGGVGRFTLSASLDRTSSTNSEPVSLSVRVGGSGNIRMVGKPEIAPIAGLKVMEPEVKDETHASDEGVRGVRTFRFPVIPQNDGKYVIPSVAIAYFDPLDKSYHTLQAGPFEFSASGSATSAPLMEATGLKVLGTDISYIKPDAVSLASTPLEPPWWPNLLHLLSLGMVSTAFWYRGHNARLLSDRGYARKTRSSALVRRRLQQAEKLLKKRDEKAFHAALTQAVMGYLGDHFNIDTHAMTKDQLRAALEERQVASETTTAVIGIVDDCELARFSPGLVQQGVPQRLLERAREVLGRI